MSDPTVLVDVQGAVGWVRLNRPDRRNAIDGATRALLAEAFASLDANHEVRVAVLTGEGTAFCAGVDLSDAAPSEVHALADGAERLVAPLDRFSKPLVAAVNGAAAGGGFELALAADLRIASTNARFSLPEVRIGSLPGSGGTQRLARAIPSALANVLLFTGEPIDADTALRYGLVSEVVPPEELEAAARSLAARVAGNAPLSLIAMKKAIRAMESAEGMAMERTLWALLAATEDRAEGRAAFREKRDPKFKGL